jgi:hypothetical protein
MSKCFILLVLISLITALSANPVNLSLRTGMILPDDGLDNGLITGLTLGYEIFPAIEAQLSIDYHQQNSLLTRKLIQTATPYESSNELSDVKLNIIPISFNVQHNFSLTPRIIPIIGAGLGMSFLREEVTPLNIELEDEFESFEDYSGLNALIWTGFKYDLSPKLNFLSKVFYRHNELKSTIALKTFGHIENKQNVSGMGANLGIEYSF